MDIEEAREINRLLFNFVGLFHEKVMLRFRKIDADYPGLKKNHYKIMGILSHCEYLLPSEIGRRLDIEKGSVTTLIDQLEESGLVSRCSDPWDRRRSQISLNEAGRELMTNLNEKHARLIEQLLANSDDGETMDFIDSLRFAVAFMKKL